MKARLVPVYFDPGRDEDFDVQVGHIKTLLADQAELLEPVALGESLPDADAVVFPQLLGEGYRQVEHFKKLDLPILVVTSEFGTLSMWDWELARYLRTEGVETIAPYNLDQTRMLCRTLAAKRELKKSKFVVFQDKPGEAGCQPGIFKRFYWWEGECIERMHDQFGVKVVRKSFETLGEQAKAIPDQDAQNVLGGLDIPTEGLNESNMLVAIKIYMALKREAEEEENVCGMGINCLNESHFSNTTPCLAWDLLYAEKGIVWSCEGDIMSLMSMVLLNKSLDQPVIMTNIYPFLLGMAALKHEKIPAFPDNVDEPENHILLAHCGYFGIVPRCLATEWTLRPKVLGIVDENAHAIDARMPTGATTLAKLDPTLARLQVVEADLKGYAQYPGSDCRNGAVLKVPNGHAMMRNAYSHHQCLLHGHWKNDIEWVASIFGLDIESPQ